MNSCVMIRVYTTMKGKINMFVVYDDRKVQRNSFTSFLRDLAVGQSFECPIQYRKGAYQAANNAGIKIRTQKLDASTVLIERIA